MTSQSPRIYLYKITFEEVPYYYYGVHKEKRFNENYWGTPVTNKWCWKFYTPKKQILEIFNYDDEGWLKSQEIEKQLIKPFFNTDKWCLNERCGGNTSLKVLKGIGLNHRENGTGIFSQTPEERKELGRRSTLKCKENGTGIYGRTKEEMVENGKKNGLKCKANGTGIFSMTPEEQSERSRKTASQRWECLETGFISNAPGLSKYQNARGIDTSKRKRIA
jgi:hypothetical protein